MSTMTIRCPHGVMVGGNVGCAQCMATLGLSIECSRCHVKTPSLTNELCRPCWFIEREGSASLPLGWEPHHHGPLRTISDDDLRDEYDRREVVSQRHMRLEAERDEWKRRAEAAEAMPMHAHKCVRIVTDGELVPLGSLHDFGRIELLVTRVDGERLPFRDLIANEAGPGIARLPEPRHEPIAFLDEDLLCEDA